MNTGQYISLAGHVGLIGVLLFGGSWESEPLPFDITEVSVVSSEAYEAALRANDAPAVETNVEAPVAPSEPAEDTATPSPDSTPSAETPEVPVATPDDAPEVDTTQPAPVTAEVVDTPPEITPPAEDFAALVPERSVRPRQKPIERIAPTPAAEPQVPDAQPEETVREETVADEPVETPVEEVEAAAPAEATTEIDPEAADATTSAPKTSVRPKTRPQRAAAQTPDTADAVSDALQEALSGGNEAAETPAAPTGPPLTGSEREGLKLAVSRCWNLGALSSDAMQVTITVGVDMTREGKPVVDSIRLINSSGGSDAAAKQAYEAARRAIIRCGASGYNLPAEKFEQWRSVEMKFNPESMR